jgi:hypothetical protein
LGKKKMLNMKNVSSSPETDHSTGGHQASSRVFREDSKNECYNILEESATTQMEEETTSSLRARDVGALTTLRTFARIVQQRKMMVIHLD